MEQRNQTGLFAGNDSTGLTVQYRVLPQTTPNPSIPPLARPRGHRTPTELSRQRKVETIRAKESFQGFQGNIHSRPKTSPALCHYRRHIQNQAPPTKTDIVLLTRQNPRNYTAVNNQGVVHREHLSIRPRQKEDSNEFAVHLATGLAQSNQTIGPTTYYSTLCQRSPEALRTLLSNRKYGWTSNQYTGFNVKSYRQVPLRQVRFEDAIEVTSRRSAASSRPRTAISGRQLLVPQPFIYKGSNSANRLIRTAPAYTTSADMLPRCRRYVSASPSKNCTFTDDVPEWLDDRTHADVDGYSSPQPLNSSPETPRKLVVTTPSHVITNNETTGVVPTQSEDPETHFGPELPVIEPEPQAEGREVNKQEESVMNKMDDDEVLARSTSTTEQSGTDTTQLENAENNEVIASELEEKSPVGAPEASNGE